MGLNRKQHDGLIERFGKPLDERLFNPLTLESIETIELELQKLGLQEEYVAVPYGQPFGGPTRPIALPKSAVKDIHESYRKGLQGISPAIGRPYDLDAERIRLSHDSPDFNPNHYPPHFIRYLSQHFGKTGTG